MALILRYVTEFDSFAGRLRHNGWRQPIISAKYPLSVPVFHFRPNLTHPAARSLCDSRATCFSSDPISIQYNGTDCKLLVCHQPHRPPKLCSLCTLSLLYTLLLLSINPVASLGLVSPGAATDGVTYFFLKKTDDLFQSSPSAKWWPFNLFSCCLLAIPTFRRRLSNVHSKFIH